MIRSTVAAPHVIAKIARVSVVTAIISVRSFSKAKLRNLFMQRNVEQ